MSFNGFESSGDVPMADEILYLGDHESLRIEFRETAARNFAAWCTGLLGPDDMTSNSVFTILASMDLANNQTHGCEALGHEECDCETH